MCINFYLFFLRLPSFTSINYSYHTQIMSCKIHIMFQSYYIIIREGMLARSLVGFCSFANLRNEEPYLFVLSIIKIIFTNRQMLNKVIANSPM